VSIASGEGLHYKFRTFFESSFNFGLVCKFYELFLTIHHNYFWVLHHGPNSPRVVFFFFFFLACVAKSHLMLKKTTMPYLRQCICFCSIFQNVPTFCKIMPYVTLHNGEYNFKVREFPSKSIVFLHLFFRCSLIFIFKFFLHLQ